MLTRKWQYMHQHHDNESQAIHQTHAEYAYQLQQSPQGAPWQGAGLVSGSICIAWDEKHSGAEPAPTPPGNVRQWSALSRQTSSAPAHRGSQDGESLLEFHSCPGTPDASRD